MHSRMLATTWGLTKCVTYTTQGDHILDLVLSSHHEQLTDSSCRPPIATSDHLSVLFNIYLDRTEQVCKDDQPASINFNNVNFQLAASMLVYVKTKQYLLSNHNAAIINLRL